MGGDIDMPESDWVARNLAAAGIAVVSVQYRLAKDGVRFPVPSDDLLAAWSWATHAADLGPAKSAWHLGGASAGASLAASACLQLRDAGQPLPTTTILVYPIVHAELPAAPTELADKVSDLPEANRFTPDTIRMMNLNYVGDQNLFNDPHAFPANSALDGLPPTLVINSELDDLRASGQAFGAQLAAAGGDCAIICEPGAVHGHLNDPSNPAAKLTLQRIAGWLNGRLGILKY